MCGRLVGSLVPHSRCALVVSDGAGGFYRPPSPAQLPTPVHPPVRFTPLQSTACSNPPRASRRRAPSMGLAFPLRDISLQHPHDGFPRPPPLPSSTFLTSSTVSDATGLVGLFHPTATSRVRP